MKSICEMCGDLKDTRPAGPKGETVCLKCARKNPEALAAYMLKDGGVEKLLSGLMKAVENRDAIALQIDCSDKKTMANDVCKAIKELIVKAYERGVWIEEVKTIQSDEGLEITFNSRIQAEDNPGPEGRLNPDGTMPSADVAAKCDA